MARKSPGWECLSQKRETLECDIFGYWSKIAPDRCGCGQGSERKAETFNCEPAIVVSLAQSRRNSEPVDVPGAGDTAIVLTGMDVAQARTARGNSLRDVLLLDIGVIGIEKNSDLRMIDFLAKLRGIGSRVQEVSFVSV